MLIPVRIAVTKIRDIEAYNEKYDMANHFNFINFDTDRISVIKSIYKLHPEIVEKVVQSTFDEWSYDWAKSEVHEDFKKDQEDVFGINTRINQIVDQIKIRITDKLTTINNQSERNMAPLKMKTLPNMGIEGLLTKTDVRKDGKTVEISHKYFLRYCYPPKYRYDDIQNDKLKGDFNKIPLGPMAPIALDKGTGSNICSAVWIQPKEDDFDDYKAQEYYTVQHYKRGFELASERGTFDDNSFYDIARRTMIKELNLDCCDKMIIHGRIIANGNSKIYLFTIRNFEEIMNEIPVKIKDKNIIGSKYTKYSDLKPWSKWHIEEFDYLKELILT